MGPAQIIIAVAGLVVQVLVLHSLIRGPYREFPMLFLYCILNFLETAVLGATLLGTWHWTPDTARLYWIATGITRVVVFCTLLGFLWRAMEGRLDRAQLLTRIIAVGSLSMIASALLAADPRMGHWLTKAARNLSFISMLLSLLLWTMLLKRPDKRLLLLCAGFGIILAGSAIGHSLRAISRESVFLGNLFLTLSYIAGQFVWWRALRCSESASVVELRSNLHLGRLEHSPDSKP